MVNTFKATGCTLEYLVLTDFKLREFVWKEVPWNVLGPPDKTRVHFIFAVIAVQLFNGKFFYCNDPSKEDAEECQ